MTDTHKKSFLLVLVRRNNLLATTCWAISLIVTLHLLICGIAQTVMSVSAEGWIVLALIPILILPFFGGGLLLAATGLVKGWPACLPCAFLGSTVGVVLSRGYDPNSCEAMNYSAAGFALGLLAGYLVDLACRNCSTNAGSEENPVGG